MNSPMDELLRHSASKVNQKPLVLQIRSPEKEIVQLRMNKRFAALGLSLVACILLVIFSFSPHVLAYVVNLLKSDHLYQQIAEKGLITTVGKGASNRGITINVENVYVDQNVIVLDMIQTFTKETINQPLLSSKDVQLFINGNKLGSHSGGQFDVLPDGRYGGIIYYNDLNDNPEGPKLPEQFELTVKVDTIGTVKGGWTIKLPVSRKLSDQATKIYEPAASYKVADFNITVSKVIIGPLYTFIDFEVTMPENNSIGNMFNPSSIAWLKVEDEKGETMGKVMLNKEQKRKGNQATMSFTEKFATLKKLPKLLLFVPEHSVPVEITDSTDTMLHFRGEPIEEFKFHIDLQ
ncbi:MULTISPECIES: DUF4179 domain-containing protein [unclassified Paenibacillus]|uniref:DUF4179 domain-containing protein n=1 Tax=unclassified Paenibacillus TaxID=185978 RepID=UPI0036342C34